jgi:phytoene dehydrogenase-like protein
MVHNPTDLSQSEQAEWAKLMGGLGQIDADSLRALSLREWAENNIRLERVRLFFYAMCRQACFFGDMNVLSAGYAIKQAQLAALGVIYVEGGWQTVVEELRERAVKAGATIATGCKAEHILLSDGSVRGVLLSDGTEIAASAVIAASGPDEVCRITPDSERTTLGKWKAESHPIYAACVDIALKRMPYPERLFAVGLDQPLYYSNHSASVKLSENGANVIHLMKYNDNLNNNDSKADEKMLYNLLHLVQPGWDKEVVAARFLPRLHIAHASRTVLLNGGGPAPGPAVPEVRGLYVAGDWVGTEGRLADAAMASAKLAAQQAAAHLITSSEQ